MGENMLSQRREAASLKTIAEFAGEVLFSGWNLGSLGVGQSG